jgi:hypothetical protein
MGFNYNHEDQDRMLNKFSKVNKRNQEVIDEDHSDFDPTTLPIDEQLKYWERKKIKESLVKEKVKRIKESQKPEVRFTINKK